MNSNRIIHHNKYNSTENLPCNRREKHVCTMTMIMMNAMTQHHNLYLIMNSEARQMCNAALTCTTASECRMEQ